MYSGEWLNMEPLRIGLDDERKRERERVHWIRKMMLISFLGGNKIASLSLPQILCTCNVHRVCITSGQILNPETVPWRDFGLARNEEGSVKSYTSLMIQTSKCCRQLFAQSNSNFLQFTVQRITPTWDDVGKSQQAAKLGRKQRENQMWLTGQACIQSKWFHPEKESSPKSALKVPSTNRTRLTCLQFGRFLTQGAHLSCLKFWDQLPTKCMGRSSDSFFFFNQHKTAMGKPLQLKFCRIHSLWRCEWLQNLSIST